MFVYSDIEIPQRDEGTNFGGRTQKDETELQKKTDWERKLSFYQNLGSYSHTKVYGASLGHLHYTDNETIVIVCI